MNNFDDNLLLQCLPVSKSKLKNYEIFQSEQEKKEYKIRNLTERNNKYIRTFQESLRKKSSSNAITNKLIRPMNISPSPWGDLL